MYTTRNFKPYSTTSLNKSKSTDNFYRQAAERSLKYQPPTSDNECRACQHEQSRYAKTTKAPLGLGNIYTSKKTTNEQYYKTNDKDELSHLKKTKRYLEQLLERTKNDLKNSVDTYETKLAQLTAEVKQKDAALFSLQKIQNQKEAEQYYLANASLVQTYKQNGRQNQEDDENKAKKIKDLIKRNDRLEQELASVHSVASERQHRLEDLELEIVKMREFEVYARQYESMRILIDKMEEEKLQLLDRQHITLQQIQAQHKDQHSFQETKLEELRAMIVEKSRQLTDKEKELQQTKNSLSMCRDEQYDTLRELLDQREKQCLALQSRLNCIESELNFVKGRYGYILRLSQNNQLVESRMNQPDEYCIERVGRYQMSNGKESLIGMNLSPIKRR